MSRDITYHQILHRPLFIVSVPTVKIWMLQLMAELT